MESYKKAPFYDFEHKNAPGGPKFDTGGPCPKPYINITFWGGFFAPEAGKPVLEWKSAIWAGILSFFLFWSDPSGPGRLRNLIFLEEY